MLVAITLHSYFLVWRALSGHHEIHGSVDAREVHLIEVVIIRAKHLYGHFHACLFQPAGLANTDGGIPQPLHHTYLACKAVDTSPVVISLCNRLNLCYVPVVVSMLATASSWLPNDLRACAAFVQYMRCVNPKEVLGKLNIHVLHELIIEPYCHGVLCFLQAQTAGNKQAAGVTADEVRECILKDAAWLKEIVNRNESVFPNGYRDLRIVLDNAQWNTKAKKDGLIHELGLSEENFIKHPPNSYDFQLPIEQAWSTLVSRLKRALPASSIHDLQDTKDFVKKQWEGGLKKRKASKRTPRLIGPERAERMARNQQETLAEIAAAKGQWSKRSRG